MKRTAKQQVLKEFPEAYVKRGRSRSGHRVHRIIVGNVIVETARSPQQAWKNLARWLKANTPEKRS